MTPLLSASGLTLLRGSRCLFDGLDFALDAGGMLLVEGSNGSGKTSLLRAIAGLSSLERGDICWQGESVSRNWQRFRTSLVWLAHRPGLKADLTPVENLRYESGLRVDRATDCRHALEALGVGHCAELPVRSLSAGQQRRVGLARLQLASAPLWLLDEPFTNLDSAGSELVLSLLSAHLQAGGLAVVASHQPLDIAAPVQRIRL